MAQENRGDGGTPDMEADADEDIGTTPASVLEAVGALLLQARKEAPLTATRRAELIGATKAIPGIGEDDVANFIASLDNPSA